MHRGFILGKNQFYGANYRYADLQKLLNILRRSELGYGRDHPFKYIFPRISFSVNLQANDFDLNEPYMYLKNENTSRSCQVHK